MNLFQVQHDGDSLILGGERYPISDGSLKKANGNTVTLGVRPEDIHIDEVHGIEMIVDLTEELGADAHIFGSPEGLESFQPLVVRVDGRRPPLKGDRVKVVPQMDHIHLFDSETGLRLNGDIPDHTPHAQLADVEALQDEEE